MTLAYNFLELGPGALCVAATWLIPVAVRSAYMAGAVGGLSACLAKYFKKHLSGPLGVQTVGVVFNLDGTTHTIYARLTNILADGEGLKYGLDVFGYGGLVPCIRCMNVLKKGSNLAHRRPGFFVEVGCYIYESRRFILRGQAELVADMIELRDARAEVHHARSMTSFKNL